MTALSAVPVQNTSADAFGERRARRGSVCYEVLGARFRFHSDSPALLALVDAAYARLPAHRLAGAPEFHLTLDLLPRAAPHPVAVPPPVRTHASGGLLCGVMDARNYLMLSVDARHAMVVVSEDMLTHAYYVRYELIEFAVFLLAARAMTLVPLHAACVGRQGRAALLLGASGAGKSTLALHAMLQGWEFIAEDGVLVAADSLLATGVANFLHLRAETLSWVQADVRAWLAAAPVIQRRSGVRKFEIDIRGGQACLAPSPSRLVAVVFLSPQAVDGDRPRLRPLPAAVVAQRLADDQPYAAGQPGWREFLAKVQALGAFELHRGPHPSDALDVLRGLLE
nr:serine kinase [Xanthomonas maliensis]